MSCCPTDVLPVKTHYDYRGNRVYIAGQGNKKGLLYCQDIFGPHPNSFHVADLLAAQGFLVVAPDFFRGKHWKVDEFPPVDGFEGEPWTKFLAALDYELVRDRVDEGLQLLKALGATSVGALGFCWAGRICVRALGDGLIKAAASPHPAFITVPEVHQAQGAFYLMPAKEDGEMLDLKEAFEANPKTAAGFRYKYWDDMHHGFCSGRGDFSNELNRQRVTECIDELSKFFHANL